MEVHSGSIMLDAKCTFLKPYAVAGLPNQKLRGYIRIKPKSSLPPRPCHVMLVLDCSKSMKNDLDKLEYAVEEISKKLRERKDKISILTFAGETKTECIFQSLQDFKVPKLRWSKGSTDFKQSLASAKNIMKLLRDDELKISGTSKFMSNESFEFEKHAHFIIHMSDGADYGNVPWNVVNELKEMRISVHTLGVGKNVQLKHQLHLMKIAECGNGRFNYAVSTAQLTERMLELVGFCQGIHENCLPIKIEGYPGVQINRLFPSSPIHDYLEKNQIIEAESVEIFVHDVSQNEPMMILFEATVTEPGSSGDKSELFMIKSEKFENETATINWDIPEKILAKKKNTNVQMFFKLNDALRIIRKSIKEHGNIDAEAIDELIPIIKTLKRPEICSLNGEKCAEILEDITATSSEGGFTDPAHLTGSILRMLTTMPSSIIAK